MLKNIQKIFGKEKLHDFPTIGLIDYLIYVFIYGIKQIPLLNLLEYTKEKCLNELVQEIDFIPYQYKHGESMWTRFFQNYYLQKFGIDKRKAHYSSLICSNQLSRKEALSKLKQPLYAQKELQNDLTFVLKKLNLSKEEFKKIINQKKKLPSDYPSHLFLFKNFEFLKNMFRSFATKI